MKKITYIIALAAVVLAAATSCQKEEFNQNEQNPAPEISEGLVFSASLENTATKTTITNEGTAGYKVCWEATDTISVNGVNFVPTINPSNPASATFSKASNETKDDPTAPYKVYYPASIYDGTTATLPSTQTYTADGSVAAILPMYAESSDLNLNFKNLCGLMKFTLKGTEKVQYITLTDDTKALSGKFTVTDNAAVLDAEAKGGVTLYCGADGVQLDETDGKTFYIAVPAGSYDKLNIKYFTVNCAKKANLTANATATVERNKVYPFTQTPTFKADYFYFKANTDGSTVTLNKQGDAPAASFQTSTDGTNWTDYTVGTSMTLANAGDNIYFRANGTYTQLASASNKKHYFSATGSVDVGGNVMYLLDETNPGTSFSSNYALASLFSGNTSLKSASDLILPATTLANYCYSCMFNGCTSLTTAPELPATTLAESCYYKIFYGCFSLTTPPVISATKLAKNCYYAMFNGCTKLTAAPELPATTLAESCYYEMFSGASSLTTAPELPATTLAASCYNRMFKDCKKLAKVTMLATDVSATGCLSYWLSGAGSSVSSPTLTVAEGIENITDDPGLTIANKTDTKWKIKNAKGTVLR